MNPHKNVADITLNDPQLAVALIDYTLWLVHTPNVRDSDDLDEILDFLYLKVGHFRDERNKYLHSRLAA